MPRPAYAAFLALVPMLLAGCEQPLTACTLIYCSSGVSANLPAVFANLEEGALPLHIHACVDGDCVTGTVQADLEGDAGDTTGATGSLSCGFAPAAPEADCFAT